MNELWRPRVPWGSLAHRYGAWLDLIEAGYGREARRAEAWRCEVVMLPLLLEERQKAREQEAARIAESARRKRLKAIAKHRRILLARPIDMGGPRDVWLEFYPSPDPRLDNMAPVSPNEMGIV